MGDLLPILDSVYSGRSGPDQAYQPLPAMDLLPTITPGAPNGASLIASSTSLASDDVLMTNVGGVVAASSAGFVRGPKSGWGKRFLFDGRRFEVRVKSTLGRGFDLIVDGKVDRRFFPKGLQVGSPSRVMVDFGSNTETFYAVNRSPVAAGTGYVLFEEITLDGGTFTRPAKVVVMGVSGGVPTHTYVSDPGEYSVLPSNPVVQASATGAGTGATFSMSWSAAQTTRKPRAIEIRFADTVEFGGLNIDPDASIYPWAKSLMEPRRLIVGDSFVEFNYADYVMGSFAHQLGTLLGDCDTWTYGKSGMGWAASGNNLTDATVQSDIVAAAPDRVTICLGTNDGAVSAAALQAAVTARLNELMAALPNTIFTVVTGFTLSETLSDAQIAGVAAVSAPSRVAAVNAFGLSKNNAAQRSSDAVHPTQFGHDLLALWLAPLVRNAEYGLTHRAS